MLERLEVRNLGIIEKLELEMEPGFVVLTGATGAGKSLLVESLKLLSGARASSDLVRSGEKKLLVEAWFSVPKDPELGRTLEMLGLTLSEEFIVRREILSSGRSRCWINDEAVTAGTLQKIAPFLLAIHGQHEQFGLGDPTIQRSFVDQFGNCESLVSQVSQAYEDYSEALKELRNLEEMRRGRRDRLDAISYQLTEIKSCAPTPGEDDDLRGLRARLSHAGRLRELTGQVLEGLADRDASVVEELARAERAVAEMAELGMDVREVRDQIQAALLACDEALLVLRPLADSIREDPRELDRVEQRLHQLESLMLKYGGNLEEILRFRDKLLEERSRITDVEDRLEESAQRCRDKLQAYDALALGLQRAREKAALKMAGDLVGILGKLGMRGSRIEFRWAPRVDASSPLKRDGKGVVFDAEGVEEVELLLAANPGEDLRPMRKVASGGELSRLHLAIRTALRRAGPGSRLSLLFDEVDTGLGGQTASFLAELLGDLAIRDQVMVVTHLAQVAARADCHFKVEKEVQGGRALTRVRRLDRDQRVQEIARMLSGDTLSESALAHARELLKT